MVYLHGQTDENMKESLSKIWNKDMVFFNGQTEENMKDNGKMEGNMDLENIQTLKGMSKKVYGMMEKE